MVIQVLGSPCLFSCQYSVLLFPSVAYVADSSILNEVLRPKFPQILELLWDPYRIMALNTGLRIQIMHFQKLLADKKELEASFRSSLMVPKRKMRRMHWKPYYLNWHQIFLFAFYLFHSFAVTRDESIYSDSKSGSVNDNWVYGKSRVDRKRSRELRTSQNDYYDIC